MNSAEKQNSADLHLQRHAATARLDRHPTTQHCDVCLPICSGVIALVGTLGYILSFAIGAGPVTGLIVPEINKEAVRGETCSMHEVVALPAAESPLSKRNIFSSKGALAASCQDIFMLLRMYVHAHV